MTRNGGKVHVVRVSKTGYVDKHGRLRDYTSAYLRRTYRDGGTVKNETVANLSALPDHVIDLIDAGLKGQQLVPAAEAVTITASLPHGHVAAVHAMAATLGLPGLLGPAGRPRDLAMALIISRVVKPGSKLSTLTWWADTTLGADLGVADVSTDDIYAAMDWLEDRQDAIEAELARRHLGPEANPARMALFDLSSSWLEGSQCPLAARGYSRDGKKGTLQIEYGLLTDPAGRPVAVRVFPGNTGDPAAFTTIVDVVRKKFALAQMVMVGDRGMITSAGPNGIEVGKVISTYKTGKHFAVTITEDSLAVARRQDRIDAEAALDGFYVLRTPVPADELDAPGVVTAYQNLKYVERDFRHIKSDDLDLRPVFHRLEERVRAHVLICMLACYLTWHLRRAWAPLTFTGQQPPEQDNPVAPASRSAAAQAKASGQR